MFLLVFLLFAFFIIAIVISSIKNKFFNINFLTSSYTKVISFVLSFLIFFKIYIDAAKFSMQSIGEEIFNKDKNIRERDDFMNNVKLELQELFEFLNVDFKNETKKKN
jgi:hypothetical protein